MECALLADPHDCSVVLAARLSRREQRATPLHVLLKLVLLQRVASDEAPQVADETEGAAAAGRATVTVRDGELVEVVVPDGFSMLIYEGGKSKSLAEFI